MKNKLRYLLAAIICTPLSGMLIAMAIQPDIYDADRDRLQYQILIYEESQTSKVCFLIRKECEPFLTAEEKREFSWKMEVVQATNDLSKKLAEKRRLCHDMTVVARDRIPNSQRLTDRLLKMLDLCDELAILAPTEHGHPDLQQVNVKFQDVKDDLDLIRMD